MSSSYSSSFLSLSPAEYQIGGYNAGDVVDDDGDDMAVAAAASSYLSCFGMNVVGEYYPPAEAVFYSEQHAPAPPPPPAAVSPQAADECKNGGSAGGAGGASREQSRREAGAVLSSPAGLSSHCKIDNGPAAASGAGGLPRTTSKGSKIAFKTRSEVDVLDDGYRWRKYGKKMVKNSPNPRNYYRCSREGCRVKKRVERERDDVRFVVTTYDGVHNHPPPLPPRQLGCAAYSIAGPAAGRRLPGLEEADPVALFGSTTSLLP